MIHLSPLASESVIRPLTKLLVLCAVISFTVPVPAIGDSALSEQEKKQLVYDRYESYREDFPGIEEIGPLTARELLNGGQKLVFIDTRRAEEINVSALPGAISQDDYLASPETYRDHQKIAYCTIGYRSGIFSRDMSRRGETIYNLRGGILAWTLEGGTVYGDGTPVKRVHVFAERWNYAPQGYETVKFSLLRQLF